MAIETLSLKSVSSDPCDRTVLQRSLAGLNSNIKKIEEILNQVINNINVINVINNVTEINEIVNNIVNNNTFVTEVDQHINQYLNKYYTSIYANSIRFTLNAEMTPSGDAGIWQATAAVNGNYNGQAPNSPVTVIDPAGLWRWKSTAGAKGIAIRANVEGTVYLIMEIERIPELIRFRVYSAFDQQDSWLEASQVVEYVDGSLDPGPLAGASKIKVGNFLTSAGDYMFKGDGGDYGWAALIDRPTKSPNTNSEPIYRLVQMECP